MIDFGLATHVKNSQQFFKKQEYYRSTESISLSIHVPICSNIIQEIKSRKYTAFYLFQQLQENYCHNSSL